MENHSLTQELKTNPSKLSYINLHSNPMTLIIMLSTYWMFHY